MFCILEIFFLSQLEGADEFQRIQKLESKEESIIGKTVKLQEWKTAG